MDILMAIFDFVPVALFLVGAIIFQRDFYNKMSKGAFALFSAGTLFVITAGVLKALYKLLFYTNVCDFEALNKCFFPMQTMGFLLAGIGLLAMVIHPQGEHRVYSITPLGLLFALTVSPKIYNGTMLFVILMVVGVILLDGCILFIAIKNKCLGAIIAIIISFVGVLGMGYLSTRSELSDWIKEIVNTFGQGGFFVTALILRKKGLGNVNFKVQKQDFEA